ISAFLFIIIPENTFAQGPPPWAPAHGYRAKTRHIYFPDHNVYYDLNKREYFYIEGGVWITKPRLPRIFVDINLGKSVQIELDFEGDKPYRENHVHVVKYKKPKKIKHKKVKVYEIHDDHGHGHKKEHKHKH
ncbi:hypothetical protein, partial [Flavobacterium sp.]|uniref:hypothetical protein n=1 Tax=Flavobacterium sp. TaxID=239 RepID=UPI00374DCD7A